MSEIDNDDKVPTTVKQDLVQLDGVFNKTNDLRDTIIEKLGSAIQTMEIAQDAPKLMESQMGIINTYLSVLDGKEANVSRRVASKLKQVETETASKHSAAVADLLTKISTRGNYFNKDNQPVDQSIIDRQVEEAFEVSGLDPILATELKTDPKDLRE